jgi:uncharacterized membrane protein YhaH (DUF805 family)
MKLASIWTWNGRVSRSTYVIAGFLGFAIKHNLDRLLAYGSGLHWHIWNYWYALEGSNHPNNLTTPSRQFLAALLLTALPFIWIGVTMTVKRLRDAGQPLWLTSLFFAPVVNLLFFALLCVLPGREDQDTSSAHAKVAKATPSFWPESRLGSAALGVAIAVLLGTSVTWFDLRFLGNYGLTLFVALPFVMGYVAVWVHCRTQLRSFYDVLAVVSLTVVLTGAGIAAIAIEGLVCLAMAAPIAWLLAFFGGALAYTIHGHRTVQRPANATFAVLIFTLPAMLGAEHFAPPPVPRYQVRTNIEIAAPPEIVWKHIIAFPPLAEAKEWPFRFGVAYPIEARLKGEGLTADRECRFSTGSFKEPILAWEPRKHFAFAVADEPLLMKETSPYGNIHVRHLEDHDFQPERADFVLVALPNGGTRLEGTTTYQNKMWPGAYWRLWTDAIVHSIHRRVFIHVKELSEEEAHARASLQRSNPGQALRK